MAVSSASILLLRRGRAAFSALRRPLPAATPSLSLASAQKPPLTSAFSSSLPWNPIHRRFLHSLRGFSSAVASASSSAVAAVEAAEPVAAVQEGYKFGYEGHKPRDLGIDEIEGCDFNHWLIVIDFPKDPRPSHEEMVRFYEETCAKALNLSLEEAKKKIYACSTSNYTGFHVEVTEIESEKFNGQPGVVFVLPDSYVDKEKKEYGGDKYINGIIIPRPRPTLNGRRIRDDFKQDKQRRPMPDRQGSPSSSQERPVRGGQMPNQQMQSSYSHEGPTQGRPISNQQRSASQYSHQGVMQGTGGNHGAPQSYASLQNYGFQGQGERRDQGNYQFQQNYSHPVQGENRHQPNYSFEQNYGPPGQGERSDTMPMMSPGGRSPYQQGNRNLVPYQGNYNRGWEGNFHPQEYREFPQGYQMNYAPSRLQGGFREDYQNYRPAQGTPYGQEAGGYRGHGVPEAYYQGMDARSVQQGYRGPIHRPPGGYQGQGVSEVYWQGMDAGSFQQGYREPVQSQAFSQLDQRNFQGPGFHPQEHREFPQGYQRNYAPPVGYQGDFREEYRYYGPTNVEPYGQGSAMVGYQGQRAPEAYWQGTNYGTVGYGYDGPIGAQSFSQIEARNMQAQNFYSQGSNEFPHGGQRSYTPPRYEAGFRQDHQNYGPTQGTPYRQEDDGYQGQGPPMAYWRGPKF